MQETEKTPEEREQFTPPERMEEEVLGTDAPNREGEGTFAMHQHEQELAREQESPDGVAAQQPEPVVPKPQGEAELPEDFFDGLGIEGLKDRIQSASRSKPRSLKELEEVEAAKIALDKYQDKKQKGDFSKTA